MGHVVVQLVWALRYKLESRGFYGPGVDSESNRNEYQDYLLRAKGDRCVGLTTVPPSCAGCFEIWEPKPSGTLRACPAPV
jgi:hypothetical protein